MSEYYRVKEQPVFVPRLVHCAKQADCGMPQSASAGGAAASGSVGGDTAS